MPMPIGLDPRDYRGFQIALAEDGWWATACGGLLNLGPFETRQDAEAAVDQDLDEPGP